MNESVGPGARRKGQEVLVPDLKLKIEQLLHGCLDRDGRPRFPMQCLLAEALDLDPAQLSRALHSGKLSTARVPALLKLYELDAGDWMYPSTEADRRWLALALEPFRAFCARVRLAGGDDHADEGGRTWDRFAGDLRRTARTTPSNSNSFRLVAHDAADWRHPHDAAAKRMGPSGEGSLHGRHHEGLPTVRAGQWAKVFLDTRAALPQRNVRAKGAWVFAFQDVVVDRRRHIAPLVPFPADSALAMPDEHVGGGADTLLQVPLPRGREQFLEIYADWGSLRSLVAVVTERPIDEEIITESRHHRQLQLERLDLLAARLTDRKAWPEGSFTVWELQYKVEPALSSRF